MNPSRTVKQEILGNSSPMTKLKAMTESTQVMDTLIRSPKSSRLIQNTTQEMIRISSRGRRTFQM